MCTSVTECSPVLGIRSSRLRVFADWPAVWHTHLRSRARRQVRPCRPPARALAPSAPSLFSLRPGPAGRPSVLRRPRSAHGRRKQIQRGGSEARCAIKPHTLATLCRNKHVATPICTHICEFAHTHRALESKPIRSEQAIVQHPTKINIPPLNFYKCVR